MRPGVRRIVRMLKANVWNHLFDDLQKILVGPFPDFSGCESCRRVDHKQRAKPVLQVGLPDYCLKSTSQVYDLFRGARSDPEHFAHIAWLPKGDPHNRETGVPTPTRRIPTLLLSAGGASALQVSGKGNRIPGSDVLMTSSVGPTSVMAGK